MYQMQVLLALVSQSSWLCTIAVEDELFSAPSAGMILNSSLSLADDGIGSCDDCSPCDSDTGGTCRVFNCDAYRHAVCSDSDCVCPPGMCAKSDHCLYQIKTVQCLGVEWKLKNMETVGECRFHKYAGDSSVWDAVAWSTEARIQSITYQMANEVKQRRFGLTDAVTDDEEFAHGSFIETDSVGRAMSWAGRSLYAGDSTFNLTICNSELGCNDTGVFLYYNGHSWGNNFDSTPYPRGMHGMVWMKDKTQIEILAINVQKDCQFSNWSPWSDCSTTCGHGVHARSRSISQQPAFGGTLCETTHQQESCEDRCCPFPCVWNDWSEWGACSVECDGGISNRSRTVQRKEACGGAPCLHPAEQKICNPFPCAGSEKDCIWSLWSHWSECSASCGGGARSRSRMISQESQHGGATCDPQGSTELHTCHTQVCPDVDCEWTEWSHWSTCSKSCDGGNRVRQRDVSQLAISGGVVCDAYKVDIQECALQPCANYVEWVTQHALEEPDTYSFRHTSETIGSATSAHANVLSITVKNERIVGTVVFGLTRNSADDIFHAGFGVTLPGSYDAGATLTLAIIDKTLILFNDNEVVHTVPASQGPMFAKIVLSGDNAQATVAQVLIAGGQSSVTYLAEKEDSRFNGDQSYQIERSPTGTTGVAWFAAIVVCFSAAVLGAVFAHRSWRWQARQQLSEALLQ